MFSRIIEYGHEQVVFCSDPKVGYQSIIAIHSTKLGPAVGGTRFWQYATDEAAFIDALRLSRGMSYKCALAGLPFGGGKAVILGDNRTRQREGLFRAHGRFIETLGGRYITAEDVGTSVADMDIVRLETRFVAGLSSTSGDPSPNTARGVFRAIQASAQARWGSPDLAGRTVAVQGLGNVGYHLVKELHQVGAKIIATDVDAARVARVVEEFDVQGVAPEAIYQVEADIFSPCALGGILNEQTIGQLKVAIIAGAANNQLLNDAHGEALRQHGILYAPDYVANAGGVLGGSVELQLWDAQVAAAKIEAIYDTMLEVFEAAESAGIATNVAADQIAEQRLNA